MTKKFLLLASVLGGFYTASSRALFINGDVRVTPGMRFMTNAIYYAGDGTEIPSGTKTTEVRVCVSFEVDQWDIYVDFDFVPLTGTSRTHDLWVRYAFKNKGGAYKVLCFGY